MTNEILRQLNKLLYSSVSIPTDFHSQCSLTKDILKSDTSGLINSLLDYQIKNALVDIYFETTNNNLNNNLNSWLENININFLGQGVEVGIKGLFKEYLKERWKNASFPCLKIGEWTKIDGINVPNVLFFVDGSAIRAFPKNEKEDKRSLISYNYYLGTGSDAELLKPGRECLLYKPYVRWYDKYPTPYLIGRGVYKHWKIINTLKDRQMSILSQIIEYLALIKLGSDELTRQGIVPGQAEQQAVGDSIQRLVDRSEESTTKSEKVSKTMMRVTNYDESFQQLVPDIESMFKPILIETAEEAILSALGFVNIADIDSSRKDSLLNPKPFIAECEAAIDDFKRIINDLVIMIKSKNRGNIKYTNLDWKVKNTEIIDYLDKDFYDRMRSMYDRGLLSKKTYSKICGDNIFEYDLEVKYRKEEKRKGDDVTMYPQPIQNNLNQNINIPQEIPEENTTPDKTGIEKKNYNMSKEEYND